MRTTFCNAVFRLTRHRICCGRIPAWTARFGQRWDPFDVAPWNLYNIVWCVQHWVRNGMS